jgi:hypothetical protein
MFVLVLLEVACAFMLLSDAFYKLLVGFNRERCVVCCVVLYYCTHGTMTQLCQHKEVGVP